MTLNEYQTLAARTIATDDKHEMELHAAFGLISEADELSEAMRKLRCINGPYEALKAHMIKEAGDLAWMVAEMCTARGWYMGNLLSHYPKRYLQMKTHPLTTPPIVICGMYQKTFQGHKIDDEKLIDCLREIWGMLVAISSIYEVGLETVLETNIAKLRARYPHGFEAERSLHRAEGDD